MNRKTLFLSLFMILVLIPGQLHSSTRSEYDLEKHLETFFFTPAATGHEHHLVEKIREVLGVTTGFESDNLGSLFWVPESDSPRVVIAAGLDEFTYIVGGITEAGYITLDRVVPVPHSLWDSWMHGHAMEILTGSGSVPGVLALPSSHILSRSARSDLMRIFSLENAFLDIGASSRNDAEDKGIRYLDPVIPKKRLTKLAGNKWSGFSLGIKACLAVMTHAAETAVSMDSTETAFAWIAQAKFPFRGSRPPSALGARCAANRLGEQPIVLLDIYPCRDDSSGPKIGAGPIVTQEQWDRLSELLPTVDKARIPLQFVEKASSFMGNALNSSSGSLTVIYLPVKYAHTPSELVDMGDVRALDKLLNDIVQLRRQP